MPERALGASYAEASSLDSPPPMYNALPDEPLRRRGGFRKLRILRRPIGDSRAEAGIARTSPISNRRATRGQAAGTISSLLHPFLIAMLQQSEPCWPRPCDIAQRRMRRIGKAWRYHNRIIDIDDAHICGAHVRRQATSASPPPSATSAHTLTALRWLHADASCPSAI